MKRIIPIMVLLFFINVFVSCEKAAHNQPPRASAGPDQVLILPVDSTELRGVGIDEDGSIISYEWKKIDGPVQFALQNNMNAITKVKNLVRAIYFFELTVKDDAGSSTRDSVVVTVLDVAPAPCNNCWDY